MRRVAVAEAAEIDPRGIIGDVVILQDELSEINDEQAGEHKATYDQIKALADEIQTIYDSEKPSISTIKAKAKEIAKLAEQLPGDTELAIEGES